MEANWKQLLITEAAFKQIQATRNQTTQKFKQIARASQQIQPQ